MEVDVNKNKSREPNAAVTRMPMTVIVLDGQKVQHSIIFSYSLAMNKRFTIALLKPGILPLQTIKFNRLNNGKKLSEMKKCLKRDKLDKKLKSKDKKQLNRQN